MRLVYIAIGWTFGIFIASHLPNFPPTAWLIMALGFFLLTWANRATIGWRWALISLVAFSIG
ncbi:MAG: hypothetical protein SFZ02_00385, partial [bacterium]|nr:hypothetical protein [bacterium]